MPAYIIIPRADMPLGTNNGSTNYMSNYGLRIGYNSTGRDGWVMQSSTGTVLLKGFYVPNSDASAYTFYAVSQTSSNTRNAFYSGTIVGNNISNARSAPINTLNSATGLYSGNAYSATNNIIPEQLNINIPIYDTLADGVLACDDDNWTYTPIVDPYDPGGNSGTGGGGGNFDGTSDPISIPSLPTLSAADAGMITLYNPSVAQVKALANYMWNNPLFDVSQWKKIFADPMDAILGLSVVPVSVPNGVTKTVYVGNVPTDVTMTTAASQYVEVDCGSINVLEYWGAYLDYSPYTKAEIYLPYIGTHELSVDDVMGKTVQVVYHVDILSGACCAYVKCGSSVLYNFIGQCSSSIPVVGRDWTNVINGVLGIAGSIGSLVGTGGMSAPLSAASAGSLIAKTAPIASAASNVLKPSIEKSGAMAGTGGLMSIQKPYMILTRPRQAVPKDQKTYTGYPSYITKTIGQLTGYTEIEIAHYENVTATERELEEIDTLMRGGVIL